MSQNSKPPVQTLPGARQSNGGHEEWIAGRVEVLLSHYPKADLSPEVRAAAMGDWIDALHSFSQPAIEHACSLYLRNQPRRRPTPGDIATICETWVRDRERASIGSDLSPEQARAVEWAVMTYRMGKAQAVAAVKGSGPVPEWCSTEAEAAVYRIRHSPDCQTPDEGQVTAYRKMVRV